MIISCSRQKKSGPYRAFSVRAALHQAMTDNPTEMTGDGLYLKRVFNVHGDVVTPRQLTAILHHVADGPITVRSDKDGGLRVWKVKS